ncbi:hypothetical protein CDL15_Pgr003546 [Punica granatum]|uniref:Uncharacterized protein n=1 Tax=Punica granatum TaxID=22663 RepID=A0A218X366_PUNGR|nr:hypothetical protein CDL15_Pgr003546 [Punica granatum]
MEKQIELEQTHSQLKHLEGVLEEMNTKLGLCEKENEGLTETNLKLIEELASYESKFNDLQVNLYAAKESPPLLPALLSENHTLRMWMVVVVATAIFLLIGIVGSETNGDQQPPSIDDPNWRLDLLQDLADYAD